MDFITKDSGERKEFAGGMQRDVSTGKMRPDLVLDGPMFLRWAELLARGAEKYGARNWCKAAGSDELARFRESAFRHFVQWWFGKNPEEDHAAAVFFNINGVEHVKEQMQPQSPIIVPREVEQHLEKATAAMDKQFSDRGIELPNFRHDPNK